MKASGFITTFLDMDDPKVKKNEPDKKCMAEGTNDRDTGIGTMRCKK